MTVWRALGWLQPRRVPSSTEASEDWRLRPEERKAAVLDGKYPAAIDELMSESELRLARLMSPPHF